MQLLAFKMKLHPGKEEEYKRRHDELWPELEQLLKESGVHDYSIFLDHETNSLFSTLKLSDQQKFDSLPSHPIMKKWWTYMRDIMETNPDHSPVSIPLKEVFHLS